MNNFRQKLIWMLLLVVGLAASSGAAALSSSSPSLWMLPSYSDGNYSFESTNGPNTNKFSGSIQTYSTVLYKQFGQTVLGTSLLQSYNHSISEFFSPGNVNNSAKQSNSTNINVFLTQYFFKFLAINAFTGISDDRYILNQTNFANVIGTRNFGSASFGGNTFNAGLGTFISLPLKPFWLSGSVTYLYLNSDQNGYSLLGGQVADGVNFDSIRTETSTLNEIASLWFTRYRFFQPFVDAGALQVLSTSSSQPEVTTIISPLPALDLDKNGIQYGGGINIVYRQISAQLGFERYERGNEYRNDLITGRLSIPLG